MRQIQGVKIKSNILIIGTNKVAGKRKKEIKKTLLILNLRNKIMEIPRIVITQILLKMKEKMKSEQIKYN